MLGKQYSLDSRIDLAEAVDQANVDEETKENEKNENGENSNERGRSLSVIENSAVAGIVQRINKLKRHNKSFYLFIEIQKLGHK